MRLFLYKKFYSFYVFFIFCCAGHLASQTANPPPSEYVTLGYRQKFNNYIWQFNGSTIHNYKRWKVSLSEQFHSSMLLLGANEEKWKDDQNLLFDVDYLLRSNLFLQTRVHSLVFNDKQSGLNNNIRTHLGSVGLEFLPVANVMTRTSLGPKWDLRLNQYDSGMNYNLEVMAKDLNVEDYINHLQLKLEQDIFHVRRNHDVNVHYLMYREFSPGTQDSLTVFTNDRRVDNYLSSLGDIESLRERMKGFTNDLNYRVAGGIDFRVRSALSFKNVQVSYSAPDAIQKERRRNDQRLSNELGIRMHRSKFKAYVLLSYWTQQQKYDIHTTDPQVPFSKRTAFITPDNESNRLNLTAYTGVRLSSADSLYCYFSSSRFQYDTPDTNNFDDRDELRMNIRLVFSHRFSSMLSSEIQATLNLYHMVYIFGERSADNNWNRILRLSPVLSFSPNEKIRLYQAFEVLANYVDYDFENPNVLTKSFVFRKFAINDSLQWHITNRSILNIDYRLQMEENGQLAWEDWSEIVLLSRQNHWLHFTWKYSWRKNFYLSPGYTFYRRDEWRHKSNSFGVEQKEKTGTHISHGPILRFYYAPSQKLHVVFDGVRYKVRPVGQKAYFTNTLELSLAWYL
jgi:hypothetical protein